MKLEMKMTQRDKKLLIFLVFFLATIAFYLLVVKPGMDTIAALQEEIALSEQTKFDMQDKISVLSILEGQLGKAEEEWAETSAFIYDRMSSQEVDRMVTAQVLNCGLKTKSLSITIGQKPLELSYYGDSQNAGIRSSAQTEGTAIYCATVVLRAEGSREQVRALVDTFTNDYETVRITSYSYEGNAASDIEALMLADPFGSGTSGTEASGANTTGTGTTGGGDSGAGNSGTGTSGAGNSGTDTSSTDPSAADDSYTEASDEGTSESGGKEQGETIMLSLTIDIYMCEKQ